MNGSDTGGGTPYKSDLDLKVTPDPTMFATLNVNFVYFQTVSICVNSFVPGDGDGDMIYSERESLRKLWNFVP